MGFKYLNIVYAGTLHSFILRTDSPSREVAVGDFNKDGRVDVNDCNALEMAMAYTINTGHTGNSVYDIASVDPNAADPNDPNSPLLYIGIRPDGVVDGTDVRAIYQLMDKDKQRREAIAPVMRGDIYKKMDGLLIKAVKETYDKVVG